MTFSVQNVKKTSTETLEATESATAEAEATADSWGLKYVAIIYDI